MIQITLTFENTLKFMAVCLKSRVLKVGVFFAENFAKMKFDRKRHQRTIEMTNAMKICRLERKKQNTNKEQLEQTNI